MRRKRLKLILTVPLVAAGLAYADFQVDFSRIVHWSGEGSNEAALVVQFLDDHADKAYVWGYRWNDGEEPTGETLVRAVAGEGKDLCALVQYTGGLGYTLDGLGYSRDNGILDYIDYDYANASVDPYVMFGFNEPNTLMGQTVAPGGRALDLCRQAIEEAKESGVIEHPLNQREYGYPAYDSDWWQPVADTSDSMRWNAGWYTGYWSYWLGSKDVATDGYSYSGFGMSSVKLKNGDVNAWKFMPLDGPVNPDDFVEGETGASVRWSDNLDYVHFDEGTSVPVAIETSARTDVEVFTISGQRVGTRRTGQPYGLPSGLYVIKYGDTARKILVKQQ